MVNIMIKRIYDPYDDSDGYRALVDRLWPRGVGKEEAKLTDWAKEIAPSSELRKWFGHQADRFDEFQAKYIDELRNDELKVYKLEELCQIAKKGKMTLLYAAKDPLHNHARVLKEEMLRRIET